MSLILSSFLFWIASFLAMTHCCCSERHCEERSNPEVVENQIDNLLLHIMSIIKNLICANLR